MAYRTDDDAQNAFMPLGTSEPLAGLGKDEANALVVVVPTTTDIESAIECTRLLTMNRSVPGE